MTTETLSFQAEVSRLLDIVAHALYSEKEVFLRELISNAADACDKHRYLALTEPETAGPVATYAVTLAVDEEAKTLTISDNGIGMSRQELIDNLGTIANSGTGKFVANLTGDAKKDLSLIGQFGVGFYSSFMVADKVTVLSRRAGEATGHSWESDGKGSFQITEATRAEHGTDITLHLKAEATEFLHEYRLENVVRRYADHVALPVKLGEKTLNDASALWAKSKSDVTEEQLKGFYEHISHDSEPPFATIQVRAEGTLEYSALLFAPKTRPFDLFDPDRKHGVKLYVRRVFITDEAKDLLPGYLRFVKGVVDSADLPLNVSRELLQASPLMSKIRSSLVKKILAEFTKKADSEDYPTFWEAFGPVLKEGLYEDFENREALLKLARFRTTAGDGWISLADYVGRMKEGQDAIYVASGDDLAALRTSPQLEGFKAKGVEVLLLTDPIDEFWLPSVPGFENKQFKSVTRGAAADLDKIAGGEEKPAEEAGNLSDVIAAMKLALGDKVKDVRPSKRLTDSACCLVADEGDMDLRFERLMRQHKRVEEAAPRVLELNPTHAAIKSLIEKQKAGADLSDAAWLLLDQARILDGEPPLDAGAFARRLSALIGG